jgi:hypothetical protein
VRFESLMWSILIACLIGGVSWGGGDALQKDEVFEAADGGSMIPPP